MNIKAMLRDDVRHYRESLRLTIQDLSDLIETLEHLGDTSLESEISEVAWRLEEIVRRLPTS